MSKKYVKISILTAEFRKITEKYSFLGGNYQHRFSIGQAYQHFSICPSGANGKV
jgi:hypothetical protein